MKKVIYAFCTAALFGCSQFPIQSSENKEVSNQKDQLIVTYPPAGKLIAVADLKQDLKKISSRLDTIHPAPSFTMKLSEVKAQIERLKNGINSPMTQLEAWRYLSQLNPTFNDGHMVISFPQYKNAKSAHQQAGGKLFPLDVTINYNKRLFVTSKSKLAPEINIGDEITGINGEPANQVTDALLSRMHGDNAENQRALAASRFSKMYWLLYGDSNTYQLDIKNDKGTRRVTISGKALESGSSDNSINQFVKREVLNNQIGYLRIDRFYYSKEHEQPYFDFMNETWQTFKQANVQDVIIDVRDNPGGTDHYWQLGIAPYVANEPFPFLSTFKMRMTERNLRLGPISGEPGTIAEGTFDQLVPVDNHQGLRIPGKAYLLMSHRSYSSTILFLSAFKDSQQAVIAGESNARSCTTGRIETINLPGSGLELTMPTLIFTRPSGNALCQQSIQPDLSIIDDPLNERAAISKLANLITELRSKERIQ